MMALPVRERAADRRQIFDRDTQTAIASGLCIQCRGAKLLCGKERCPILVRWDFMMRTAPMIDRTELDGSSPPGVFVGRFGYPKVFVGPLIPPFHGDTSLLDTPESWFGRSIKEIVDFRFSLVRGKFLTGIKDFSSKIVEITREIALANESPDVEVEFEKKPYS